MKEAATLTIAPIGMKVYPDRDFDAFCLKRLQDKKVESGKEVDIIMLGHRIPFVVKECSPDPSKVGKNTKLVIMSFNTRSDMTLEETDLNVFMSDEEAKQILSKMILKLLITEKNGIEIWKEFKKKQDQLMETAAK